MFRALHKPGGQNIIILEPRWRGQIQTLRGLDKKDELVCPGCQQPVRVRAGRVKRWHFAHKHLQNCPFERESPALLNARAVLYHWLVDQFGMEAVSLEKILDPGDFYRPLDCWVESQGRAFAYWILERRLPPEERAHLQAGFDKMGIPVHWLFTINMLREDDPRLHTRLHLTTTERAFMSDSEINLAWTTQIEQVGGSLHYLDSGNETLSTFRNLILAHSPQLYAGTPLKNPLREVQASPETGEFIHPGENERYQKRRREIDQQRRQRSESLKRVEDFLRGASLRQTGPATPPKTTPQTVPFQQAGTCKFCGAVTSDWVTFFGQTGECICRNCKDRSMAR